MKSGFKWSCYADSNCRPHPYQLAKVAVIECLLMLYGTFLSGKFRNQILFV